MERKAKVDKLVIPCHKSWRLTRLRKQTVCAENLASSQKDEEEVKCLLKISPDRIFPFRIPNFPDEDDPLALSNLRTFPVEPIEVTVTANIPIFNLQVPRRSELMGCQPVSTWEAFNSYISAGLLRPLLSGPQGKLLPSEDEEEEANLSFVAPDALLRAPVATPLRIFNPAPGLQAYKPSLKYLEGDLESHLCPLPRYQMCEHGTSGTKTKFPKDMIAGLMTWKNFDWITFSCLSMQTAPTNNIPGSPQTPLRSVDGKADLLPSVTPPPLRAPPDDLLPIMDKACQGSGVLLSPEMIGAQFLCGDVPVSNSNHNQEATEWQHMAFQTEVTCKPESNQMGKQAMATLHQLC